MSQENYTREELFDLADYLKEALFFEDYSIPSLSGRNISKKTFVKKSYFLLQELKGDPFIDELLEEAEQYIIKHC